MELEQKVEDYLIESLQWPFLFEFISYNLGHLSLGLPPNIGRFPGVIKIPMV